ncbi:hypothetical protein B0O80DRAFT_526608 [Mortierella sp. GBAus27b]|nr:hypothetical protein B0O80DRAFT_526608 [Mortierella sp. GBAus27b]
MPGRPVVFDVDLIMDGIGRHLDRKDLANCALVSKSFRSHFQRLLWREFEAPIVSRVISERGMPLDQELALRDNSQHIRYLTLHTQTRQGITALLASACNLLYGLTSHVVVRKNETNDTPLLLVLDLVSNNKRLRTWTLYSRAYFSNSSLLRLTHVLSNSYCLTTLNLELSIRPPPGWTRHLLQSLPLTLQTIHIQWGVTQEEGDIEPFPNNGWPSSYPSLEVVDLDIYLGGWDVAPFFQFLERCPRLTRLTVPRVQSDLTLDSVVSALESRPLSSTLTSIDTRLVYNMNEFHWGRFLRALRGRVKEITTRMAFNTPLTIGHIPSLTSFWKDTLETIHIEEPRRISSNDIYLILSTCSKLKKFYCLHPSVSVMFEEEDDELVQYPGLEAVKRKDWVCTEMEVFELSFADMRRSRAAEPALSLQEGWCQDGIRHVYQQLGRLTKLQRLAIGWSTPKEFSGGANLDMSLQSGLEHLEGLTSLTTLDIKHVRRLHIGPEEANWMLKSWPALREIRGTKKLDNEIRSLFLERHGMTLK